MPYTNHIFLFLATVLIFFSEIANADSSFVNVQVTQQIDSLNHKRLTAKDEDKIDILIQLATLYGLTSFHEATKCGNDALSLAESTKNNSGKVKALHALGKLHIDDFPDQALEYFLKTLPLAYHYDEKMVPKILLNIGVVYNRKGNYNEALNYYFQTIEIAEKRSDIKITMGSLNNIGIIYEKWGLHKKAIENYKKAIDLIKYSLDTVESRQHLLLKASLLNNIGVSNYKLGDYDEALGYYFQSLEVKKILGGQNEIALAFNNIGTVYSDKRDLEKTLEYYSKALSLVKKTGNKRYEAHYTINVGLAYADQKKYTLALIYFNKCLAMADSLQSNELYMETYNSIYKTYKTMGDYASALEYHERFIGVKDSLFTEKSRKNFEELQTRYETAKKEKELLAQEREIALLKQQKHNQSNLKNLALAGIFIALFVIFLLVNRQRLKKKLTLETQKRGATEHRLKEEENLWQQEKLQKEHEVGIMRQKQLEEQIAHRERELATSSLYTSQRNEMLEDIMKMIEEIIPNINIKTKTKLRGINKIIQQNMDLREDWNTFKIHFEQVNPDFFSNLKAEFPKLTPNYLKLCAYIKINLTNKEIARLLNISSSGMKTARNRLKKKLNLLKEDSLNEFIMSK